MRAHMCFCVRVRTYNKSVSSRALSHDRQLCRRTPLLACVISPPGSYKSNRYCTALHTTTLCCCKSIKIDYSRPLTCRHSGVFRLARRAGHGSGRGSRRATARSSPSRTTAPGRGARPRVRRKRGWIHGLDTAEQRGKPRVVARKGSFRVHWAHCVRTISNLREKEPLGDGFAFL